MDYSMLFCTFAIPDKVSDEKQVSHASEHLRHLVAAWSLIFKPYEAGDCSKHSEQCTAGDKTRRNQSATVRRASLTALSLEELLT